MKTNWLKKIILLDDGSCWSIDCWKSESHCFISNENNLVWIDWILSGPLVCWPELSNRTLSWSRDWNTIFDWLKLILLKTVLMMMFQYFLVPNYQVDTSRLHHPCQYRQQCLNLSLDQSKFSEMNNFYNTPPLQLTLGSNEFGPSAVFHPVWHCVITLASTCVLWLHPSIPWPQPRAYPLAVLIKFYT